MAEEIIEQNLQFKFVVDGERTTNKPEDNKAYIFSKGKFMPILGVQPGGGTMTTIPKPERDVLARGVIGATESTVQGSSQPVHKISKIDYTEDGIFIYYEGLLYPRKGFPYPEMIQAANIVKKALVGAIRSFSASPLMALGLLRRKTLGEFLHQFTLFAETTMDAFYWKPEFYSKTAKEINKFITTFVHSLGFIESTLGKVVSHLFESDDAYMLRLQDIMNETTKEALLKNPIKEINRLLKIFKERESRIHMNAKVQALFFLLRLSFLIPRFKRAFN